MNNVSSSNSQKALVPELRFPEFRDEWKSIKFANLFEFLSNNTLSRADLSDSGTVKNIHYGDILIKFGDVFSAKDNTIPFVKDKTQLGKNTDYLKNGDIIIADTAEDDTVGKATEIQNITNESVVSGLHTIPCRAKEDFAGGFLGYYLNSSAYHSQLYPLMQGIKVTSISKGNISKTELKFPSVNEQGKIACMLSLIDKKLEAQKQMIDSLKLYKRGFLSSVFNDKNTIQNNWKKHKIKDFLSSRDHKQLPSDDAPLMAFIAYKGVAPKGERYDRSFLVKDENKLYKYTDMNDFIYSSNNLDVGSIGLNDYGPAVISDVYEVFTINKAVPTVISEAIKQPEVLYKIIKFRQGVTYGQYRIYAEDFLNVEIYLPDISEQEKLAKTIISMNSLIQSEEKLLADLTDLKTSLLQKMFI